MKRYQMRRLPKHLAIVGILTLLAIGVLIPATAFAAGRPQAKCAANDVKCVITAGDALIAQRLTALGTLSDKITTRLNDHKITGDQANALQADVTTNKTGLTNLKAKLDAETTTPAARQDVASVFTQFRIYAVVLPRDYRQLEMNIEINAKNVTQGAAPTIKAAIAKAPANKQARLNALFSDYQSQVAAAGVQIDAAQKDFPALTPANFNQHRASLVATKTALDTALKTARTDLHQAARDLKQMMNILGLNNN